MTCLKHSLICPSKNPVISFQPEHAQWPRNLKKLSWKKKPNLTSSNSANQLIKPQKSFQRNVTTTNTSASANNKRELFKSTLDNTKENKDPCELLSDKEIQTELNRLQTDNDDTIIRLDNFMSNWKKKHRLILRGS